MIFLKDKQMSIKKGGKTSIFCKRNTTAGVILAIFCLAPIATAQMDSLRAKIEQISIRSRGIVGVALEVIETGDTLTVNGNWHFPMQSVYKFPLALAVLHQVDEGKLSLEQKIHVSKSDLLPKTWSPPWDKYPEGNIDLSLKEIFTVTALQSDNNGCDILFRLMGGPEKVDQYIHGFGVAGIAIVVTEEEIRKEWSVQYGNWSTPSAHLQLLKMFHRRSILSQQSTDFLRQIIVKTTTGPRRLKGLLPPDAIVAHKTGSSGANNQGVTAATNDVGILTLPDGRHLAIVVFVSDALAEEPILENVIAKITKAAWMHLRRSVWLCHSRQERREYGSIYFIPPRDQRWRTHSEDGLPSSIV